MGPIRASTSKQLPKDASTVERKPSRKPRINVRRGGSEQDTTSSDVPGVQKLKSALRQTQRLLAKDKLAADVRVETERRLKSLEADLEASEKRRKERSLAMRYHKVKFFERKKVLRKIKQAKKESEAKLTSSSKEAATQFENTLFELRVELNYILNFPKLEKYISLFPPSKDKDERNPDDSDETLPLQNETEARRAHLLDLIRQRMIAGELSGEPELNTENGVKTYASTSRTRGTGFAGLRKEGENGVHTSTGRTPLKVSKRREKSGQGTDNRMKDDDFFDTQSD